MKNENLIIDIIEDENLVSVNIKNTTNEPQVFEWDKEFKEDTCNIRVLVQDQLLAFKIGWIGKIFKFLDKKTWGIFVRLAVNERGHHMRQFSNNMELHNGSGHNLIHTLNYMSPYQEQSKIIDMPYVIKSNIPFIIKNTIEPYCDVSFVFLYKKAFNDHRVMTTGIPVITAKEGSKEN